MKRLWSDEEIDLLKDKFAIGDLEKLAKQMHRTVRAVVCKANTLGLNRRHNNSVVDGKKFCSFCKEWHSVDQFYRNGWKCDGYEYYCKKYYKLKEKRKESTVIHKEMWEFKRDNSNYIGIDRVRTKSKKAVISYVDGVAGKVCTECKTWKGLDEFSKYEKGVGGRNSKCKECYNSIYKRKKKVKDEDKETDVSKSNK